MTIIGFKVVTFVVDDNVFNSNSINWTTFRQKDFLFVRISTERFIVQSDTYIANIVLNGVDEQNWFEFLF